MIKLNYLFLSLVILLITISCKRDYNTAEPEQPIANPIIEKYSKISHVTFYIENSGSMLGYVNGPTQFVNAVNDLAQFPNLVKDDIPYSYNFISGKEKYERPKDSLTIKTLGNSAEVLKSRLTKTRFETPSSGHSDLKNMFDVALNKAITDRISILISDCIYDVGGSDDPLQALRNEATSTRTNFINRLKAEDIETLLIKLESDFDGYYHPANVKDSKGKSVKIKQKRPYYIWVFGNSELLNKYFPENRIKDLDGYIDIARFRKLSNKNIPYKAIGYNNIGFKLDFKNTNAYELYKNVTSSSHFNVAVDFSSLTLSQSYLVNANNYSCTGNFDVEEIFEIKDPPSKLKPYLKSLNFNATHILTISTSNHPEIGEMTISLNNVLPNWINESSTDDDYPFDESTTETFGFNTLIQGIEEAYKEISNTNNLAQFNIQIKQ